MDLYSASSCRTSKALRYGPCVTKGSHSFTCHPHTNHTCLYSLATRHYRPLAGTNLAGFITKAGAWPLSCHTDTEYHCRQPVPSGADWCWRACVRTACPESVCQVEPMTSWHQVKLAKHLTLFVYAWQLYRTDLICSHVWAHPSHMSAFALGFCLCFGIIV